MKGFKKDGKFRPTEKKSKSSLKKNQVLTDKFGRRSDSPIKKTVVKKGNKTFVKFDYFGKGDPKYDKNARHKQSLEDVKPYTPQSNDNRTPEEVEEFLDRASDSLRERYRKNTGKEKTDAEIEEYKDAFRFGSVDYMNFYDTSNTDKDGITIQDEQYLFAVIPKGSDEDDFIKYFEDHFPLTDLELMHVGTDYGQAEAERKFNGIKEGNAPIPRSEFTKDDEMASNWWGIQSELGGQGDWASTLELDGNQFGSDEINVHIGDPVAYEDLSKPDQLKIKTKAKELKKDGQIDKNGRETDW